MESRLCLGEGTDEGCAGRLRDCFLFSEVEGRVRFSGVQAKKMGLLMFSILAFVVPCAGFIVVPLKHGNMF